MFRGTIFVWCFSLFALSPHLAYAMTDEQRGKIHERFIELAMQCVDDFPITEEDVNNFRDKKMGTSEHAACFIACVMKKGGVMDENGLIEHENALEHAKTIFDDPEELQNIADYLHSCNHVNDVPVGDGTKGCERATLSFVCMAENASKFGIDV